MVFVIIMGDLFVRGCLSVLKSRVYLTILKENRRLVWESNRKIRKVQAKMQRFTKKKNRS